MRVSQPGTGDVTDRAARALGAVSAAGGATWDTSDRIARLVGVVDPRPGNSYDGHIFNGSVVTNPAISTLIANSGDLAAGVWEVEWAVASQASDMSMRVQLRNAADSVTDSIAVAITGRDTHTGRFFINVAVNFDVVVQTSAAIVGTVSAYIAARRLVAP